MESADEKSTAASRSERTALILERGAMGAAGTASRESSAAGAVTAGAVVSGRGGEAGQKSQAGKNIEWQALQQLGNERR